MTTSPSIEVLIPFYGDPDFLKETVTSLQDQTLHEWRATVIDDCYPGADIREWVRGLDDPRITALRNDENLGANGNYKRAVEVATADYVVILGADDRLLPEYLASVVRIARDLRPTVIQPVVRVIDERGAVHRPLADRVKDRLRPHPESTQSYAGEALVASLLGGNWTYFPSLCWRREAIAQIGFRPYDVIQDLALLIDVILAGGTLVVDSSSATFEYRRHSGSDSATRAVTGARFEDEREYFLQIARELDEAGWGRAARAARLHWSSRLNAAAMIPTAVRAGDRTSTARLLRHVVRGFR